MKTRLILSSATTCLLLLSGCAPHLEDYVRPESVTDFKTIFSDNCSGCHGSDGHGGAAQPMNDSLYQHLVDKETMRKVISDGRPGTAMSAFSKKSGGFLTDDQIGILIDTMQKQWGAGAPPADMPPYNAADSGDAQRGVAAYQTFCSSCHGPEGTGGKTAGSIVDPSYLALVSDQSLRTTTIAGRTGMHPDWRTYVSGHPMSAQDVSDVVAWIVSHRPSTTAQNALPTKEDH